MISLPVGHQVKIPSICGLKVLIRMPRQSYKESSFTQSYMERWKGWGSAAATEAQCFIAQASLGINLFIIIGSFAILLTAFFFQARAQYRKNVTDAFNLIDKHEVGRLSSVWHSEKQFVARYEKLNKTFSYSSGSSMEEDSIQSVMSDDESRMTAVPLLPMAAEDESEMEPGPMC